MQVKFDRRRRWICLDQVRMRTQAKSFLVVTEWGIAEMLQVIHDGYLMLRTGCRGPVRAS